MFGVGNAVERFGRLVLFQLFKRQLHNGQTKRTNFFFFVFCRHQFILFFYMVEEIGGRWREEKKKN